MNFCLPETGIITAVYCDTLILWHQSWTFNFVAPLKLNMTILGTKNDSVMKYMTFCGGKNGDVTACVKKFNNLYLSTECMKYGLWVAAVLACYIKDEWWLKVKWYTHLLSCNAWSIWNILYSIVHFVSAPVCTTLMSYPPISMTLQNIQN